MGSSESYQPITIEKYGQTCNRIANMHMEYMKNIKNISNEYAYLEIKQIEYLLDKLMLLDENMQKKVFELCKDGPRVTSGVLSTYDWIKYGNIYIMLKLLVDKGFIEFMQNAIKDESIDFDNILLTYTPTQLFNCYEFDIHIHFFTKTENKIHMSKNDHIATNLKPNMTFKCQNY